MTPGDDTVLVDNEKGSFCDSAVGARDCVGAGNLTFRLEVGEERESQRARQGEGLMTPDAVDGDAEQFGPALLKLGRISLYKAIWSPQTGLQSAG